MDRTCGICGTSFSVPPSKVRAGQGKFCSRKCAIQSMSGERYYNWKGGRPTRICSNCGKEFQRYDCEMAKPGEKRTTPLVFCSKDCAKPSVEIDDHKYVKRMQPHHPYADKGGRVLEQRLVAEKFLGRFLEREEVAHHVNGQKRDNRPENIAVLNSSKHQEYHRYIQLKKQRPSMDNLREWAEETGNSFLAIDAYLVAKGEGK